MESAPKKSRDTPSKKTVFTEPWKEESYKNIQSKKFRTKLSPKYMEWFYYFVGLLAYRVLYTINQFCWVFCVLLLWWVWLASVITLCTTNKIFSDTFCYWLASLTDNGRLCTVSAITYIPTLSWTSKMRLLSQSVTTWGACHKINASTNLSYKLPFFFCSPSTCFSKYSYYRSWEEPLLIYSMLFRWWSYLQEPISIIAFGLGWKCIWLFIASSAMWWWRHSFAGTGSRIRGLKELRSTRISASTQSMPPVTQMPGLQG